MAWAVFKSTVLQFIPRKDLGTPVLCPYRKAGIFHMAR